MNLSISCPSTSFTKQWVGVFRSCVIEVWEVHIHSPIPNGNLHQNWVGHQGLEAHLFDQAHFQLRSNYFHTVSLLSHLEPSWSEWSVLPWANLYIVKYDVCVDALHVPSQRKSL